MKIPIKRYWALLVDYLKPQWRLVLLLAALLFSGIGLKVISPQILRYFIDAAMSKDAPQNLIAAAIIFLVVAIVIQILSVATTYVGEYVGWTATNNLRADLALHCLRMDMSFHNEHTPGEMIERIDGDVVDLAIFFSQFVISVLGNLLLLVGVLIALYLQDWRIGAAFTIYSLISLYSLNRLRDIAIPHWKAAREASADLFSFVEEQLAGTEDIRASGATQYVMHNLFKFDQQRLKLRRAAGRMETYLVQLWVTLYDLGRIVALIVAFYLFSQGQITIGIAYLIVAYTDTIFNPLREITQQIQNLQKAGGSIERIQDLYKIPNKIVANGLKSLPDGEPAITFENVSFAYNGTDLILRGLSFNVERGKVLGLLGHTGSGKTTITRLLFRLYDITSGKIYFDSTEIRDLALAELEKHIGMVTQDVQLFRATVRDNLSFFDPSISDSRIVDVLEDLGLGDWYRGLPKGLDTELESGGKGLSAGEAQLVAFARVFLKNPGLVILDEASSRLDPVTEQQIERAVDKLLRNRTGIIVAHRLATVQRADQILILDHGQIREYGDYTALMRDENSQLRGLLKTGMEEVLL